MSSRPPEVVVESRAFCGEFVVEFCGARRIAADSREHGQRPERLDITTGLVEFHSNWQQRPAFHPAVPDIQIARETSFIQSGPHKGQRFAELGRLLAKEADISAGANVFSRGDG